MLKKIYTTAFLALALVAGCKKDPGKLVGPTNAYSTSNYPASVNDLQSVLAACYSNMRDPGYLGFHYLPKAISNSTHVVNSVYNGDPAWNDMANTNVSAGNLYATEAWTVLYTGIKNCNVLIAGAKLYNEKYSKSSDGQSVNYILGQAYFLRGYYYFQLECLFGASYMTASGGGGDKMGVPIYADVPRDLSSTQQPRSTVKQVWDFIEGDFKQAATLLKGKVWQASEAGRITEWAAKGMLGKSYVYTQDWANAKTTLLDVIQNSGKSLMPYAKYKDAFYGNSANEFNEESLFELNIDPDSKGGYGVYSGAANATSINGLIWCPWVLGGDGTEGGSFPLGYGNEFFHDKNVLRFGYDIGSSYNLVANPNFDSSKPASYSNPAQVMDPVYRAKAQLVRANKTADPRLFINALQPWLDTVKFDGVNKAPVAKPNFFAGNTGVYGWSLHKYAPTMYNENNGAGNGGSVADAWNYYFLRLADVYLLYAEASIGAGDKAAGLEYLNKVKRRAYNYPVNGASPVDYASLTSPTKAISDPVLGNNPLYYERWAELLNEGHWWFDVCRWKIGKSEAAYFGTAINVTGPFNFDEGKSYVWPIPTNEINTNSKIKQNPGY
ncbi:RagB/SusD family nutrient uptake outer membrane protein [Mucilaginibacter sp.]|uniref:RagB/SusD family nutrient uptake outer membrane protein n=1 Tax=Mucilaginibacter sp. TaxID=1882438 RepID=UPI00260E459B|nr:RagB/SusD family nutrient uptake outer membrane protein [Mucilaginibacter sp.]MDB4923578.1 Starch-binding associating with outer rane [Mucilaginibacter sp.]